MRNGGWIMATLLLAAGCQGETGAPVASQAATGGAVAEAVGDDASDAPGEAAPTPAPSGRSVEVSNDLYEFSYAYPDAVGATPGVAALLDTRLEEARNRLIAAARDDRAAAKKDGYPYRPHSFGAKWSVVTALPDWLSLSAEIYTYTGGAHGMTVFDTLLWDRRADTVREPADLFTSADALRAAVRTPFCDALDREREKRRGEPVRRDSGQMFTECIDPMAQTLILGSANGTTFDRIGFLVAPYEAGPYAEGTFEVTLPVTAKVMATLKPQYRSSFSVGR